MSTISRRSRCHDLDLFGRTDFHGAHQRCNQNTCYFGDFTSNRVVAYDFTDAPDKTIHRTLTLPTDRWVSSVAVTKTGIFVLGNTPGQPSVPDTVFSTYPVPARYRAVGVR